MEKEYVCTVLGEPVEAHVEKLMAGVDLGDCFLKARRVVIEGLQWMQMKEPYPPKPIGSVHSIMP